MKIALKFRCYPTKQQAHLIHQTTGNDRFIYNYFLNLKSNWWQLNKDLPKAQRIKPLSSLDCINLLPQLKQEIYSLCPLKIKSYEQRIGKSIDFMTINSNDFESLKIYWLANGLSTALQQTLRHLDSAFTDFYQGKKNYPKFKKKTSSDSFTITPHNWRFYYKENKEITDKSLIANRKLNIKNNNIKLNFSNTTFKISCCEKPLYIKFDKLLKIKDLDITKISQVTVSYNPAGQYFISFLVDEELLNIKAKNFITENNNYLKNNDLIGNHAPIITSIDVGIKNSLNILTTKINNEKEILQRDFIAKKLMGLKRHDKRLRKAQKNLSCKKKGSNNYKKQQLKVAKQHNDLVNYRTDFYHKSSTEIVLNSDKVIVENLAIKNMVKNKNLAKSISQQAWGEFFTMIKYKSQWYNKELIIMDRYFPSSKLCSHCHRYNKHVKQQDIWTCSECKTEHQRDENAVVNMCEYEFYEKVNKHYVFKGFNQDSNKEINNDKNQVINEELKEDKIKKNVLLSRQEQELMKINSKACGEIVRPKSRKVKSTSRQISTKQELVTNNCNT